MLAMYQDHVQAAIQKAVTAGGSCQDDMSMEVEDAEDQSEFIKGCHLKYYMFFDVLF